MLKLPHAGSESPASLFWWDFQEGLPSNITPRYYLLSLLSCSFSLLRATASVPLEAFHEDYDLSILRIDRKTSLYSLNLHISEDSPGDSNYSVHNYDY